MTNLTIKNKEKLVREIRTAMQNSEVKYGGGITGRYDIPVITNQNSERELSEYSIFYDKEKKEYTLLKGLQPMNRYKVITKGENFAKVIVRATSMSKIKNLKGIENNLPYLLK